MMTRFVRTMCLLPLLLAGCATNRPENANQAAKVPPVLLAFQQRLPAIERGLPEVQRAAAQAAARTVAYPQHLINVPYAPGPSFAEEMMNRSGCLANVLPDIERAGLTTEMDVFVFAVRSWEENAAEALPILREARRRRWLIVLCASRAGAPSGVEADFWLDNGATSGGADHAPLNAIINVVNGWLWQLEYVAALTRHQKHPGVIQGVLEAGAAEHNAQVVDRDGRRGLYDLRGTAPVPAGRLGAEYLAAVRRMVAAVGTVGVQGQLEHAAGLIAAHRAAGGKVGLAAANHILLYEIFHNTRAPWQPFNIVWQTKAGVVAKNVGPGDLLVYFGHVGVSTPYEDYGAALQGSGARLIVCYAPDLAQPTNDVTGAVARIQPTWRMPDAAVAIPFAPGHMAPVSGIEEGLLFRMLDDAVARRLEATRKTVP